MKYKYTGSSPALLSIDGKLTMIMPGAIFVSSGTYPNNTSIEKVSGPGRPKKVEKKVEKKVTRRTRKEVDGTKPSSS